MYNQILKLASAIHNNIMSGLAGYHTNYSISLELLEDMVVDERISLLQQYLQKGLISNQDVYNSINCIKVDCKDIENCRCNSEYGTPTAHFEIPLLYNDTILYLGSPDKEVEFNYTTSISAFRNRKYRKRGKNKPYVWIDTSPNENNMYDCFLFNAPLIDSVSITAIFKDPRQLENYNCCIETDNKSALNADIVERLSKKLIYYYRSAHMQPIPNNQQYTPA